MKVAVVGHSGMTGVALTEVLLARAVVDEVENQALVHKHWTLAGEQQDD